MNVNVMVDPEIILSQQEFGPEVLVLGHFSSFTFINSINVTFFPHLKPDSH